MGDPEGGCGFSVEMFGLRASDHDRTQACRKKHEGFAQKSLKQARCYGIILIRDTIYPCSHIS